MIELPAAGLGYVRGVGSRNASREWNPPGRRGLSRKIALERADRNGETMSKPPVRAGTRGDPRKAAEAAFRSATTPPREPAPKSPAPPGVKELVSLRIDQDVLEHFQEGGPGWQERINEALRKAAAK